MRTCGICKQSVNCLMNFTDIIGNPRIPIYKIILKCTSRSSNKYLEDGVCDNCAKDLATYHEAVVAAKKIKKKILYLIENNKIIEPENETILTNEEPNFTQNLVVDEVDEANVTETICEIIPFVEEGSDCPNIVIDETIPKYPTEIIDSVDYEAISISSKEAEEMGKSATQSELSDDSESFNVCLECGILFDDYKSLKMHNKKHHWNQFICEACGKVMKSQKSLKRHLISHGNEKPFECDICQKRFHFKNILEDHRAKHSGERPFKCEVCDRSFATKSAIHCHKMVHKNMPLKFKCDICPKAFRNNSRLKAHILKHCNLKNHICKFCNRGFNVKYYLTQHMKDNKTCQAALLEEQMLMKTDINKV